MESFDSGMVCVVKQADMIANILCKHIFRYFNSYSFNFLLLLFGYNINKNIGFGEKKKAYAF